jgi:hypothetical protein
MPRSIFFRVKLDYLYSGHFIDNGISDNSFLFHFSCSKSKKKYNIYFSIIFKNIQCSFYKFDISL